MKTKSYFIYTHSELLMTAPHFPWGACSQLSWEHYLRGKYAHGWYLKFYTGYYNGRENGKKKDKPVRAFPRDGALSYVTVGLSKKQIDSGIVRPRYDEGPGDRAWMEEKDKNYLTRIKREGQAALYQREMNDLKGKNRALYDRFMQEFAVADIADATRQAEVAQPAAAKAPHPPARTSGTGSRASGHTAVDHIPARDLTQHQKLGEGAYGIVYQGTWQSISVAIKQLKLTDLPEKVLAEFDQEAGTMANLRFPHIVQFYGVCVESPYRIIMEYCPNGSLYSVLHSHQAVEWSQRYQWGGDMGKGLHYLHSKNILHRDLKSLNVLLDKQNDAKLTDFGLAKVKSQVSSMTAQQTAAGSVGTLAWMAPELSDMKPTYSPASDVYAYGMVLWELASRDIPFKDAANAMFIPMWVQQGKRPAIPQDCPPTFATLIGQCWAQRAEARPNAQQVVEQLQAQAPAGQTVPRGNVSAASHPHLETKGYQSQASQGYR